MTTLDLVHLVTDLPETDHHVGLDHPVILIPAQLGRMIQRGRGGTRQGTFIPSSSRRGQSNLPPIWSDLRDEGQRLRDEQVMGKMRDAIWDNINDRAWHTWTTG